MLTIVYFENGRVVKLTPEPKCSYYEARDIINSATCIVSDGMKYNLEDRNSIYSIEIPKYSYFTDNRHAEDLGVTGYLEYVLRMHAGGLWSNGNFPLSMACLEKATQLMAHSTLGWQRKDFYRIVNDYIRLSKFKKAKEWKDWIDANTENPDDYAVNAFHSTVASCEFLNTDFVEVGDLSACCEVCAKYRKRIYSLSGKNWKFPKFPNDFHFQCGLNISPYVDGVSEPSFRCFNPVIYSRRPFHDDRTAEERENYKESMKLIEKSNRLNNGPDLNHIIYYWFKPKFPDDLPKSLSGFSRMRNANTENYQKLIAKIINAGYKIPMSLDEAAEWDIDDNLNGG